jgi:hypothetical protein
VAATTPLGAQSAAAFSLVVYGLSGLRHGAAATAASCAMSVAVYLVAAQAGVLRFSLAASLLRFLFVRFCGSIRCLPVCACVRAGLPSPLCARGICRRFDRGI